MNQTHNFHKDSRPTIVEIEGKYYDLVLNTWTFQQLLEAPVETRPHIRRLHLIPDRTPEEQQAHNEQQKLLHGHNNYKRPRAITLHTASALGIDIPNKVRELLELKDSIKDAKEKKRIRKQLRKLDYKRYLKEEA